MAYGEKVLDHYENPRNVGSFESADNVGTGMVGAPACGDVMKLQIKVSDEGVIEDAVFKTYGCGSAIASSSLLTEWVKGKTLDEAQAIKNTQIAEELALPPVKIHCSVLAEDATETQTFVITNDGPGDLEYSIGYDFPVSVTISETPGKEVAHNQRSANTVTKNARSNSSDNDLDLLYSTSRPQT